MEEQVKTIEDIQALFTKANQIYKITKDIDLGGGTLTIPEGCTLDFQGGSIREGTIYFSNTLLNNEISIQADITGSILNDTLYLSWFCDSGSNHSDVINSLCGLYHKSIVVDIPIKLDKPIYLTTGTHLIGNQDAEHPTIIDDTFNGESLFCCFFPNNIPINNVSIEGFFLKYTGVVGSSKCPIGIDLDYVLRGSYFKRIEFIYWDNTVIRGGYHGGKDVSEGIIFEQLTINTSNTGDKNFPLMLLKRVHESYFNTCRLFNSSSFGESTTFGDSGKGSPLISAINCNNLIFQNCFFGAQKGKLFDIKTTENLLSGTINIEGNTFEQCLASDIETEKYMLSFVANNTSNAPISRISIINNRFNLPFYHGNALFDGVLMSTIHGVPLNLEFTYSSEGNDITIFELDNVKATTDNANNIIKVITRTGSLKLAKSSTDNYLSVKPTINYSQLSHLLQGMENGIRLGSVEGANSVGIIVNGKVVSSFSSVGLTPLSGSTENRPNPSSVIGVMYFDTTLGKYTTWNGTDWVNVDGTALE